LGVGELGAPQHRVLLRPRRQHVLDFRECLRQTRDQRLRLVDHRPHEQRADPDYRREGRQDRRGEADPTRHAEAPLQYVGDGGEVDAAQHGDKHEQQHLDHPDDEPDGEGRNEERHERGARQP